MNTRDVLVRLRALGCTIEDVNRTGEIRIRPPGNAKFITTSHPSRRKTAAKVVTQLLKRLEAAAAAQKEGTP